MASDPIQVKVRNVTKSYRRGSETLKVLDRLSVDIPQGEFLGLMGPSGSGKTTLLNLIAGLDTPDSGSIEVAGAEISGMSESELASWRTRNIGFVFQFYHLLPVLSAFDNVELPLLLLHELKLKFRRRSRFFTVTCTELEKQTKIKR